MAASSPLSSSSSLSDSTLGQEQAAPASLVAPVVHSLPLKLRHKAKHAALESEPPNHGTEGKRQAPDAAPDDVSLKTESALRNELHRLAGEVASLKTLLAPGSEVRKRAESFISNSSDHQELEEMDSDDTKDQTVTEDEQTVKSSCDSGPEEIQH